MGRIFFIFTLITAGAIVIALAVALLATMDFAAHDDVDAPSSANDLSRR